MGVIYKKMQALKRMGILGVYNRIMYKISPENAVKPLAL